MSGIGALSPCEQRGLGDLRAEIARTLLDLRARLTVVGSRARGDAEFASDMDVQLAVETDRVAAGPGASRN